MQVKDSGERREYTSGAVRDRHDGKGRCDLLPAAALLRLSKLYEVGAKKYDDRNWEKGIPISDMVDSGMRHLLKYLDGWTDEDHLCAAAWNILGAMWMEEKRPAMQNIPSRINAAIEWLNQQEKECNKSDTSSTVESEAIEIINKNRRQDALDALSYAYETIKNGGIKL